MHFQARRRGDIDDVPVLPHLVRRITYGCRVCLEYGCPFSVFVMPSVCVYPVACPVHILLVLTFVQATGDFHQPIILVDGT